MGEKYIVNFTKVVFNCIFVQELNKITAQLDLVTTKLQDKQEYCSQLESHLKEYKEKHLSLEQKTEELEDQIKVCAEHIECTPLFIREAIEFDDLHRSKESSNERMGSCDMQF